MLQDSSALEYISGHRLAKHILDQMLPLPDKILHHRNDTLAYLTTIYLDKADTRVHFQMNYGSTQNLKRIVHRRGQYLFYSL